MSTSIHRAFAVATRVALLTQLANLLGCSDPVSNAKAPKITDFTAPGRIDLGETITLKAPFENTADGPLNTRWWLAGPGTLVPESMSTSPERVAVGEFTAPMRGGIATVQLVIENYFGSDHAEATLRFGDEAPYLASLKVVDASGQERQISVPEMADPILIHVGDRFALVAEAVDYYGLPISYQWSLDSAEMTGACSTADGTFTAVSGLLDAQLTLDAPKLLCKSKLSLSMSNGELAWQNPIATLQAVADRPSIAQVVVPPAAKPGDTVTFSTEVTFDSSASLTYSWSLSPQSAYAETVKSSDASPSFKLPDWADAYSVCLNINDQYGQTDSMCSKLEVPSGWQYEGTLSSTKYINVADPNYVDSVFQKDEAAFIERFDRGTKQSRVVSVVPNDSSTTWTGLYSAAGLYFAATIAPMQLQRLNAPLVPAVDLPGQSAVFVASGNVWVLASVGADLTWHYLDGASWSASGQTDELTAPDADYLQAAVGRDDGRFLVLFDAATGLSSAILECALDAGCQSLGTIDKARVTTPLGLGWDNSGRAMVLGGLSAWRHDADTWKKFSLDSTKGYTAAVTAGDGQACQALGTSSSPHRYSVWCVSEQGWEVVGLENIDHSCNAVALAVAFGTIYFTCDGKLYSHPIR